MSEIMKTGKLLSGIHRHLRMIIDDKLEQYQLSKGQLPFFMEVARHPGMTQEEITKHLFFDKATTARALKKLTKNGLIKREVDPKDHRALRIYLTEKGENIFPDIVTKINESHLILTKDFSQKEITEMLGYLERMMENIHHK